MLDQEEILAIFKYYLQDCLAQIVDNALSIPKPKLYDNSILNFIALLGIKIFDAILYLFDRETTYTALSNKILSDQDKLEYYSGFNIQFKIQTYDNKYQTYNRLITVYNKSDPENSQCYLDFTQKKAIQLNQIEIKR